MYTVEHLNVHLDGYNQPDNLPEASLLTALVLNNEEMDEEKQQLLKKQAFELFGEPSKEPTKEQQWARKRLDALTYSLADTLSGVDAKRFDTVKEVSALENMEWDSVKKYMFSTESKLARGFNLLNSFYEEQGANLESMLHMQPKTRQYLSLCGNSNEYSLPESRDRHMINALKKEMTEHPETFYSKLKEIQKESKEFYRFTGEEKIPEEKSGKLYRTDLVSEALLSLIQTNVMDPLEPHVGGSYFARQFMEAADDLKTMLENEKGLITLEGDNALNAFVGKSEKGGSGTAFFQKMEELVYNSEHGLKDLTSIDKEIFPGLKQIQQVYQALPGYDALKKSLVDPVRARDLEDALVAGAEGMKNSEQFTNMIEMIQNLKQERLAPNERDGYNPAHALAEAVDACDKYLKERAIAPGKTGTDVRIARLEQAKELSTLLKSRSDYKEAALINSIDYVGDSIDEKKHGKDSQEFLNMFTTCRAIQHAHFKSESTEDKASLYEAWKACDAYVKKNDTWNGKKFTDIGQVRLDHAKKICENLASNKDFEAWKAASETLKREAAKKAGRAEEKAQQPEKQAPQAEKAPEKAPEKAQKAPEKAPGKSRLSFQELKKSEEKLGRVSVSSRSSSASQKVKESSGKEK